MSSASAASTVVLKAAQATVHVRRRMLPASGTDTAPQAQSSDAQTPSLRESGRWMSDADLAALQGDWYARGVDTGRENVRGEALEHARLQASSEFDQKLAAKLTQLRSEHHGQWKRLYAQLGEQIRSLQDRLEAEVTEWTFVAVSRLLGEAPINHLNLSVRQVLGQARLKQPITLRLHADDVYALGQSIEAAPLEGAQLINLVADERVEVGGCIVETPCESLDARLEVQLSLLRERLDAARLARRNQA